MLAVVGAMVANAVGQVPPAKAPPRSLNGSDAPGKDGRATPSNATVSADTMAKFKAAYEKDDSPKIVVLVGMDRRMQFDALTNGDAGFTVRRRSGSTIVTPDGTVIDRGSETRSNPNFNQAQDERRQLRGGQGPVTGLGQRGGIGADLSLYDQTGISGVLRGQMQGWLNKAGIEPEDFDALSDLDRRDVDLLGQNNDQDAIRLLATKMNTDLVMYVRLQEADGDPAATGAKFRVEIMMRDARTGKVSASDGFDWTGSVDGGRIRVYSATISSILMDSYANIVTNRRVPKFSVRLLGLDDSRQATLVARTAGELKGVKGKIRSNFTKNAETSFADLEIPYDGSASDLVVDLQDAVKRDLSIDLGGLDVQQQRIMLKATTASPLADDPAIVSSWPVFANASAADPTHVRDQFAQLYEQKGRPAVAIVIRPMSPTAGATATGVQGMDDELAKVFRAAGVRVVGSTELQQLHLDGDEQKTAEAMKKASGFDLLVYGMVAAGKPADGAVTPPDYTFNVRDLRSGEFAGSQKWDASEAAAAKKIVTKPDDAVQIARYVGGHLLEQIFRNRLQDGTDLNVVLRGVDNDRIVSTLADALKTGIDEVTSAPNPTFRDGEGRFTLRYTGSYEAFIKKLQTELRRMPFDLNAAESTPTTLVLLVKPALSAAAH